jgi:hypothetical protein
MRERLLFLTGHLAAPRLRQVLDQLGIEEFDWEVRDIGIQVAALMTADLIRKRLPREPINASKGRSGGARARARPAIRARTGRSARSAALLRPPGHRNGPVPA